VDRTAEVETLAQGISLEQARWLVTRSEEAIDQLDRMSMPACWQKCCCWIGPNRSGDFSR
jgi:hypothetical protein